MTRLSLFFERFAVGVAILFVTFLVVMLPMTSARAANCDAAGSPETARLKRQIAANRDFEAKHGCATGGSFACREIAARISVASTKLASLQGAAPICQTATKAIAVRRTERRDNSPATSPKPSARMETRCVRLSDGYYFPTPNSGFNPNGDVAGLTAQCRFICDDPAMDVYRIGIDRDAEKMVSLTFGTLYGELPKAGAYRTTAASKTCDMARFYKAALAGKQAVQPVAMRAEDVGGRVATGSKTIDPETTASTELALWNDMPLRGTRSLALDLPKKIRVVGSAYLPED